MTREPLYAAVYAFFAALAVGGSPAFKTTTRKATTWDGAAPEDQPMLMMQQAGETARYRKGLPTIWELRVKLLIYIHSGANNDPTLIPSQILNPVLDSVTGALTVNDFSNNACTLGGLVSHCAIDGTVEIFEGVLGDEIVAIVPITILTSP